MKIKSLQEMLERWIANGNVKPDDQIYFGDEEIKSADVLTIKDGKLIIKSDFFQ